MASILKVDQLQSDTGTVTVASNLAFTGAATFVGNIANPTITGTLNLTGGGIKFPATQISSADANTLDDYEEGTWTAIDGSAAGLTLGNNFVGTYIKIGKQVTVSGWPTWPSNSNAINARIGGLPFQVSSTAYHSGVIGYTPFANENIILAEPGSTVVSVRYYGGGYRPNSYLSGSGFIFSLTYMTD